MKRSFNKQPTAHTEPRVSVPFEDLGNSLVLLRTIRREQGSTLTASLGFNVVRLYPFVRRELAPWQHAPKMALSS